MSYQSKYTGLEIDNKLDKVGEIGVLGNLSANFVETTPAEGDILQLTNITGNMIVKDGNKVVVKAGQRVQINAYISYTERDDEHDTGNIRFMIRDITNNIDIQALQGYQDKNYTYEFSRSVSTQYTNDTDTDCEIVIICTNVFGDPDAISPQLSGVTIHEIGRAMVVPSTRKETVLLDSYHTTTGVNIPLTDSIFNYDEIEVIGCQSVDNGATSMRDVHVRICTSSISWFTLTCGESTYDYYIDGYIKDGTSLFINAITLGWSGTSRTAGIRKIIGIKY